MTVSGGERAVHYPDQWHYAVARMVVAARAHGLRPVDGPFGDYQDDASYLAAARRAAALEAGKGAVALDGRMIDIASIRQAEALVRQAEAIAAR